MKRKLIIAMLGLYCLPAGADIYKSVDAEGHVTYSNIPTRGAKKLNIEPLNTMPAPRTSGSREFKVDTRTQKMRDETRYRILRDELTAEERRLQASRASAVSAKGADAQKSLDDVVLHEKNIEALKQELSNLK
ncbi:MAG: DUF4124 domain-containing protein [Burkholderiales bacterium]|nr:DUF4124 domain-containing protein [Burkholderiales bacterium]